MKSGKVISLSDHYGFILDKDGVSHYFNQRSLTKGWLKDIRIGDEATFLSKAGPKGMIANQVSKVPSYIGHIPGEEMIISRRSDFSHNKVPVEETFLRIQSSWYKSPDDAKFCLRSVAKASGANAIMNTSMEKRTFSEGNYNYSMFSFVGDVGLYLVEKKVADEEEAQKLTSDAKKDADLVRQCLETGKKMLDEERLKQEQGSSILGWLLFMFVIFVFAIILK